MELQQSCDKPSICNCCNIVCLKHFLQIINYSLACLFHSPRFLWRSRIVMKPCHNLPTITHWSGSLHHQTINSNTISNVQQIGLGLAWGRISATSVPCQCVKMIWNVNTKFCFPTNIHYVKLNTSSAETEIYIFFNTIAANALVPCFAGPWAAIPMEYVE